jgi:hypothetical protein
MKPYNSASDCHTYSARLRAPSGAPHRERYPLMRAALLMLILTVIGCTQTPALDELAVFRSLHRGMTMEQARARLGQPTRETGSGIAIDVYRLSDGSEVWLGYGGRGGLIYAKHGKDELLADGGR